jgi:hypothetical protein
MLSLGMFLFHFPTMPLLDPAALLMRFNRLGEELGGSGVGLLFPLVLILSLRSGPKRQDWLAGGTGGD